jgi:hypothetical protein
MERLLIDLIDRCTDRDNYLIEVLARKIGTMPSGLNRWT